MVCHIRALVVLPTKELAQQVCQLYIQKSVPAIVAPFIYATYLLTTCLSLKGLCCGGVLLQVSKVFNIYTDTTPLRVALVTGQKSLAKEQESLVQKT